LFSEEVGNSGVDFERLPDLRDIMIIDLSIDCGHTLASCNREIGRKWSVHEIHFSTNIDFFSCMWTTNEKVYSSIIERYNRDMIFRDFCLLILMIVVLDSRFDDGFEDEKIHIFVGRN